MIYSCRISTHTFLMTLYDCANPSTAIPIIIEGRFQAFQRFSSRKLVLKAVESCFVALNYYGNGSTFLDIQIQNHCTAECKIIVSRYSGFNGFPVVNWYKKPLKAVEPLSIILQVAALLRRFQLIFATRLLLENRENVENRWKSLSGRSNKTTLKTYCHSHNN
jgi:hypothetical protein